MTAIASGNQRVGKEIGSRALVRYAEANKPGIGWLQWTASTIQTPKPSGPAWPENPSTSTPASKPSSPSN
jgi:hypothetical protein